MNLRSTLLLLVGAIVGAFLGRITVNPVGNENAAGNSSPSVTVDSLVTDRTLANGHSIDLSNLGLELKGVRDELRLAIVYGRIAHLSADEVEALPGSSDHFIRPSEYSLPIDLWSLRELRQAVLGHTTIPALSERHLSRILGEAQIRPHKVRYWLNKKSDAQREEAIRHICEVYRKAPERLARGEVTLSVDEMTGIQAKETNCPRQTA